MENICWVLTVCQVLWFLMFYPIYSLKLAFKIRMIIFSPHLSDKTAETWNGYSVQEAGLGPRSFWPQNLFCLLRAPSQRILL